MRLAFFVPAPDFEEPWRWAYDVESQALRDVGFAVDPVPWTGAGDLAGYALVLPLVAWGYHHRFGEWLDLIDRLEREQVPLFNPAALLRWNSDKRYLEELGTKGIAAVPSIGTERLDGETLMAAAERFDTDQLVIKPRVSGGASGTYRIGPQGEIPASVRGFPMIVQPMLPSIRTEGEYSLILFDGQLSHCVVKRPAAGDFRVQPHFGGTTVPCAPPDGAEALANSALAAAPAKSLYARVDIVRDDCSDLRIMELELVEPALFLDQVPGSADRFARSVRALAERLCEQPLT